jgi:hypothetical protein
MAPIKMMRNCDCLLLIKSPKRGERAKHLCGMTVCHLKMIAILFACAAAVCVWKKLRHWLECRYKIIAIAS